MNVLLKGREISFYLEDSGAKMLLAWHGFADAAQDHLRSKLHELTAGDLDRPVVAVGCNSERFDGRNLALRLAALGYTHVYWYRGGREAWEMNALPETELDVQEWESPFVPWGGYMSGRAERRLRTRGGINESRRPEQSKDGIRNLLGATRDAVATLAG